MTQSLSDTLDTQTTHAPNLGTILLIEHRPSNVERLQECFSAFGFDLIVTQNSDTALQQCEQMHPDIILLDLMIPGMSGFEVCRQLKGQDSTKDIPVIFMKTQDDTVSPAKGFSVGAVDYVTKPLQLEEILARVTAHLKIRNLQTQLEETIETLQQEIHERQRAEETAQLALQQTQQANERMRQDLAAAARVQQALLPDTAPNIPGAAFAWTYRPCAELGGDSLNVFSLNDHQVGMYVLDVTGHGVPASLLSVTLSRVLIPRSDPSCLFVRSDPRTSLTTLTSPAEVATRLNHMFPMRTGVHQYFTLLYGILNTQDGTFRYVCAGHPPPIVHTKSQYPIICEARSLPIGLFEDEHYEDSTIHLEHDSRLYLYSDGVLEAMNAQREIFGESRLTSTIQRTQHVDLQSSVESIVTAASDWTQHGQIHDDLSILAVERLVQSKPTDGIET
ncbi:MAG: transcriptional regulator [Nitrospirales bacterium]|nr:MAG: transcriptional regulator [Nitrospirales bacterium]